MNHLQDFDGRLFREQIERQVFVFPGVALHRFLKGLVFVVAPRGINEILVENDDRSRDDPVGQ